MTKLIKDLQSRDHKQNAFFLKFRFSARHLLVVKCSKFSQLRQITINNFKE